MVSRSANPFPAPHSSARSQPCKPGDPVTARNRCAARVLILPLGPPPAPCTVDDAALKASLPTAVGTKTRGLGKFSASHSCKREPGLKPEWPSLRPTLPVVTNWDAPWIPGILREASPHALYFYLFLC